MTRQQTKKNYSLRKLKTGTASVAVALTVLGAGFANQTEVKAAEVKAEVEEVKLSVPKTEYDKLYDDYNELQDKSAEYLVKNRRTGRATKKSRKARTSISSSSR